MATDTSPKQKRLCVDHGGDAMKTPTYCNKFKSTTLPENAEIKLHLQHLLVYTMPLESHQCHVILKETQHHPAQQSFGPFSVKQDKAIEEVYSCSISADKKAVMLSVSLSTKASPMIISMKSHDFCMAIFDTQSKIGIQRTMVEPGTFSVGAFHASRKDAFFVVSYDSECLPIIQAKSLNNRFLREKSLDIVDPDCENMLTLSSGRDFLILQVIEADMRPPYCNTYIYLLSPDTLEIVKKISNPAIVAPCHTLCTMNYVPDYCFEEGYIKGTFPKVLKTSWSRSKKGSENVMRPVKLPTVRVEPLKSLARHAIRSHLSCDECASELHLPEILQNYIM